MSTVEHSSYPNNPAPGANGHSHWGNERPSGIPDAIWRAYGDRYPFGPWGEAGPCRRLRDRYDRLLSLALRDRDRSCVLDRVLVDWRLGDAELVVAEHGLKAGILALEHLLYDFELLTCSPLSLGLVTA